MGSAVGTHKIGLHQVRSQRNPSLKAGRARCPPSPWTDGVQPPASHRRPVPAPGCPHGAAEGRARQGPSRPPLLAPALLMAEVARKIPPHPPSSAAGTAGERAGAGSVPPRLPAATTETRESRIRGLAGGTKRRDKSFMKGIFAWLLARLGRAFPQESRAPRAARTPSPGSAFCLA